MEYDEAPAYLLNPVGKVSYSYDAVGNRTSMTTDTGTTLYEYDKANRLLSDGTSEYYYDRSGSLTAKVTGEDETLYSYNAAGKLVAVTKPDETAISYQYDALGRKVTRTETAWTAKGKPGATPPGKTEEKGWGNNETNLKQETGKPQEKSTGKPADPCAEEEEASAAAPGNGKGKALGLTKHQQLKLAESTTRYVYDGLGLNLLKEYTANGAPKAAYTYADGMVLARKLFGVKDQLLEREPTLANGGTYYYLTDGLGSVTHLADHQGRIAEQYRYDAFGGLFTGSVGLYNTHGLTGKTYDAAAGLMDYAARWYDPTVGRFTQADPFSGWLTEPMSQHRYSYVHNNPVMNTDPTGMATNVTPLTPSVVQGETAVIAWDYDYDPHPTTIQVWFGGSLIQSSGAGTGQSGLFTFGTSTSTAPGTYTVTVIPEDAKAWSGSASFTVIAASTGTPDPGGGGGGDGGGEQPPPPPVVREYERAWEETGRSNSERESISGQTRRVTTTTTISLRQAIDKYVDGVYTSTRYEYDTQYETFVRDYTWISTGWVMTSSGDGSAGNLRGSEWEQYQRDLGNYSIYQSTGKQPASSVPQQQTQPWWKTDTAKAVASTAISFIPIVGDLKDLQEAITGVDLITGQKLSWTERLVTAGAMFVPVAGGAAARQLVNHSDELLAGAKRLLSDQTGSTNLFTRWGSAGDELPSAADLARGRSDDWMSQPSTQRPRATSAAFDRTTGKVYYGDSGTIAETIHPTLRERMPNPSLQEWPVANCAEFNACNNALLDGAKLKDLTVHTVKVKRVPEDFARCQNCRITIDGATVTSD